MPKLLAFGVDHPRKTLLFLVALTVLGAVGSSRITADYDPRAFHPQGSPLVELTRFSERVFGTDDRRALVLVTDPALFTPAGLARLADLTRKLRAVHGVERVVSLSNATEVSGRGNTVSIQPIAKPIPTTLEAAETLKAHVLSDSLLAGGLVSDDGRSAIVAVTLLESHTAPAPRAAVHDAIDELLANHGAPTRLGGFPMVRVQYSRRMLDELGGLLGVSLATLLVLLLLFGGGVRPALATVAVVVVGNLWCHGLMGLAGQRFTILSMLSPIIVLVVGVADAIHVLSAWQQAVGTPRQRAASAIDQTFGPTLLTSATTALGFLALLTAGDVSMIRQYGQWTAVGVMSAWLATVTVLPPLLALGWLGTGRARTMSWPRLNAGMTRALEASVNRPRQALLATVLVVGALAILAARVPTDARILDGLADNDPIMQTYNALERHFGGSLPMQVVYRDVDPSDPEIIAHAEWTADTLRALPGVGRVETPTSTLKRLSGAVAGDSDTPGTLSTDAGELSELFLLSSFADPDPLRPLLREDERTLRIQALLVERGSQATLQTQDALLAALASRPVPHGSVGLAGTAWVAPRAWKILQQRMAMSLMIAIAGITLLFGFLLRSVPLALVTLIPNLVPLLAVLAVMTLAGIPAKGTNAVVFSIAYGIAVDDTIHLLAHVRAAWRSGRPWSEAIRVGHQRVRRALVVTSLVLSGGFAVFLTSDFEFVVTLGLQMVTACLAALACDLLLLPALLARFSPRSSAVRNAS